MHLIHSDFPYAESQDGELWTPISALITATHPEPIKYAGIELHFAYSKREVASQVGIERKLKALREKLIECVKAQGLAITHPPESLRAKVTAKYKASDEEHPGVIRVYVSDMNAQELADRRSAAERLVAAHDIFIKTYTLT